jgi:hypothetical protein
LFHEVNQNVFERIWVDSLERTPKGPLARHVELSALPRLLPAPQLTPLSVVEAFGELGDRVPPFAARRHGKCRNRQNRRKAVT